MIALLGIVTVLLEYIDQLIPIMPALCSMLLVTYYAFNYAGIIGRGLYSNVQSSVQKLEGITADVKMEDNPAYDSSVQLSAQESDTVTDVKTEDKPARDSTMQSSVQESKDTTTDVNTDDSPTYDSSIQTSVQESKDTAKPSEKLFHNNYCDSNVAI